jgi:hypothetical protein
MLKVKISLTFGYGAFLAIGVTFCQVNQWPQELKVSQDTTKTPPDTNFTTFISGQRQYMTTFDNADTLKIIHNDSLRETRQLVSYWLERNDLFDSRKQFFDLSGAVIKKNFLLPGISLGVDWTPILLLNSQETSQEALASIDVGPLLRFNPFHVPVTLRGGASGKIENDSFPTERIGSLRADDFGKDHGFYGAFAIGNGNAPMPHVPLFINAQGYGRSMKMSHLFSGIGQALFFSDLPTGDSISLLYTDSLINGSDALMGQEGINGKSYFLNAPDRIERSYEIKGGIKGKYRFHLQPSLVYSFSRYSLMYPSTNAASLERSNLGDRRNTNQSVAMMLSNDPSFFINYSGGLRVDWENEEKLFADKIDLANPVDSVNIDTFKVKLNDYAGYRATMDHTLSIQSKSGRGLQYSFNVSRYSKTFPNYYHQGADTTRNNNDQDWIVQSHHLDITPLSGEKGSLTVSGAYSTNLRYYLKAAESANNSVDYIYNLGISTTVKTSDNFNLLYSVSAATKRTEYEFPAQYARVSDIPPYYSRGITSDLTLNRKIARSLFLKAEWLEHYQDEGAWYMDLIDQKPDSTLTLFNSYYGILRKQWNHRIDLSISDTVEKQLLWQCGISVERIVRNKFEAYQSIFLPDNQGTKYIIVPFLMFNSKVGDHFSMALKVKRYIDTIDDDYWDFTLLFTARF